MKAIYPIVGTRFRGPRAEEIVRSLQVGDLVALRRDPDNPVDPNAVKVMVGEEQIGFIPAAMAARLAPQMESAGREEIIGRFVIPSDRRPAVEIEEEQPR